jgi:hypothetical protein
MCKSFVSLLMILAVLVAAESRVARAQTGSSGNQGENKAPETGARMDVLYGCAAAGPECYYIFEIRDYSSSTPSLKVIGEQRVGFGIHDLAISDSGTIYGVGKNNPCSVYKLTPDAGAIEGPAVIGFAFGQNSLAWAPGDVLYSAGWQNGEIRKIDLKTGESSVLTTLPVGMKDMARDPTSGALYLHTMSNELHRFDPGDGKTTVLGTLGPAGGIAIDHAGRMYAWAPGENIGDIRFFAVDKKTAQWTLLATFAKTGIDTRTTDRWTGGFGACPVGDKKSPNPRERDPKKGVPALEKRPGPGPNSGPP